MNTKGIFSETKEERDKRREKELIQTLKHATICGIGLNVLVLAIFLISAFIARKWL